MGLFYKTYNVAAGYLEYKFWYDDSLAGLFDDFTIIKMGDLKQGFDDTDNIDLAIYPANIDFTINDYNGDNYSKFKSLLQRYAKTFPFNFDDVFKLEILLNGSQEFDGVLEGVDSTHGNPSEKNIELKLDLQFVDGINKLKEIELCNPYVLERLFNNGIIPRKGCPQGSFAYGFDKIEAIVDPNFSGYWIGHVSNSDQDTSFKSTIVQLFKLLKPSLNVDFQNDFSFTDLNPDSPVVDISKVKIRRILSSIFGRYVVCNKFASEPDPIIVKSQNPYYDYVYNRPEYFELVFEDDHYKVYQHTWSGNPYENQQLKFEKGVDEKQINDILKLLAKNLFSYYGFIDADNIFFRHRRFTSQPEELSNILSMKKVLSIDKVEGVRITDYYSEEVATEGLNYRKGDSNIINYKIPLNTYKTDAGYEYRLIYQTGGNNYQVIYFIDNQSGFKHYPYQVIAKAEWEAYRQYRDQYEFELRGVDKKFYKTYSVNKNNYRAIFRPIEVARNFIDNKTTLNALEIDNIDG